MARRKKLPEEHENHERWLVSYADFITLLFAFFVVMYAISQVNEGKYKVLSSSLTSAFSKPDTPSSVIKADAGGADKVIPLPFRQRREAIELLKEKASRDEAMKKLEKELTQELKPLLDDGQVRYSENKRGFAIEVPANLLFPVGSATLDPNASQVLLTIANKLVKLNNLIQIEGHTDNVPIVSPQFPSNWELSAARAGTVVRLFQSTGIAPERLVAIGYGEMRPVEANSSDAGRSRNRRVVVQLLADGQQEIATLQAGAAQ